MGVRQIASCTNAGEELIRQWEAVIAHPGLATRFDDPLAFAVTELRQQHPPPSIAELDRWAQRAHDRYETWRHLPTIEVTPDEEAEARQRLFRARAIAPPDAGELEITLLVLCLEEGLDETAALAQLYMERAAAVCRPGGG
jgi:hypothetical protein